MKLMSLCVLCSVIAVASSCLDCGCGRCKKSCLKTFLKLLKLKKMNDLGIKTCKQEPIDLGECGITLDQIGILRVPVRDTCGRCCGPDETVALLAGPPCCSMNRGPAQFGLALPSGSPCGSPQLVGVTLPGQCNAQCGNPCSSCYC